MKPLITKERIKEIKNTTPHNMTDVELDTLCGFAFRYLTGYDEKKAAKDKQDIIKLHEQVKKMGQGVDQLTALLDTYKTAVQTIQKENAELKEQLRVAQQKV
jgi:hypothetical protein